MTHTFLLFPEFKSKTLTLSYDDGTTTDETLARIADAYGIRCTFNICSGYLAKGDERHLTAARAAALYGKDGTEAAVHGTEHMSLTSLPDGMVAREIVHDKETLEKLFGRIVRGMAYANGKYDGRVAQIARQCGIRYARTTVSTHAFDLPSDWLQWHPTCHHNDPQLFALADEFLRDTPSSYFWGNKPKLFYLWGHSVEYEHDKNWDVLEMFCKKTGGRDDVYYATNGELCDYVAAYCALQTSADGKIVHNPTCTDVYLNYFGNNVCLKAGQTRTLDRTLP